MLPNDPPRSTRRRVPPGTLSGVLRNVANSMPAALAAAGVEVPARAKRCAASGNVMRGPLPSLLRVRRLLDRRQVLDRRAIQYTPFRIEARAVAGAVPALLGLVPVHEAAQVRADRG